MNEKIKHILEESIGKLEKSKNPKIKTILKKLKKANTRI